MAVLILHYVLSKDGGCCPIRSPPLESNLVSSHSIMSKIPAGCRKGACPSLQAPNRKLVRATENGRTKQESGKEMHKRAVLCKRGQRELHQQQVNIYKVQSPRPFRIL